MNLCCKPKKLRQSWSRRLLENKIVGGVELGRWYPELGQLHALVRDKRWSRANRSTLRRRCWRA